MIISGSVLRGAPIYSLQTGSEVARAVSEIVDPANLQIVGYSVTGTLHDKSNLVMQTIGVRDINREGGFLIADSEIFVDSFSNPKLKELHSLKFHPLNKPVIDEKGQKIGKVIDFTINTSQFLIQQLVVKRPLLKSFTDTELLIHRSQIVEINNDSIVIHSETEAPEPELHEVVGSYINPFRKNKPAEQIDRN